MYKKFMTALAFNSSAAFLYKVALLLHQIALYSVISNTMYGVQSSLFALMYAMIAVTNFGFEETLLPFFASFSQSKQHFLQILSHVTLRVIMVATLSIVIYRAAHEINNHFLQNLLGYCNNTIFITLILIFFTESIKKSLKSIMQLAFLNKQIMQAELGMLATYISIIWIIYQQNGSLSLLSLFLPMLITSTAELLFILIMMYRYYEHLPITKTLPIHIPFKVIAQQRLCNYIHQITKTAFSPNSMTLLFAYALGFQQAATIKFFTNIITLGYTFIQRSISSATGATFAALDKASTPEIQAVFMKVTRTFYQLLFSMSIILVVVLGYSWHTSMITNLMVVQILLFYFIGFLEFITLTYEQLFIAQHKSAILATINLVELIALYTALYYTNNHSGYLFFIMFACVKIASFSMITSLAQKYWAIPSMIHTTYKQINKKRAA